jgi:hypothetical protein
MLGACVRWARSVCRGRGAARACGAAAGGYRGEGRRERRITRGAGRAACGAGPGSLQSWAADVIEILRQAHGLVEEARARDGPADAELLAKLRQRYHEAVAFGIIHNRKRHQAVSGYRHTQQTLARSCRIRSYLGSAASHGLTALDAITAALAGKPWLPLPAIATAA